MPTLDCRISTGRFHGRRSVSLANDRIRCTVLLGGGHIVEMVRTDAGRAPASRTNPYWIPPWRTMDPASYRPSTHETRFGGPPEARLLASIMGHNLCLDTFGPPSEAEARCGLTVHGEAPVASWKVVSKKASQAAARLVYRAELPVAQLEVTRAIALRRGADGISVRETVRNLARQDRPFIWNEHVTLGPPFLEPGVTLFDMPAGWGKVIPDPFGRKPRLRQGREFRWPLAPGASGARVDLRAAMPARVSGDFTTQQFRPGLEWAWFTALNPRCGLLLGYVFRREDFPWIGNWEESRDRRHRPWAGKTYCRGLEFSTTPFPVPKREAVDLGTLRGDRCFRWIGARERIEVVYRVVLIPVDDGVAGIRRVEPHADGLALRARNGGITLSARL